MSDQARTWSPAEDDLLRALYAREATSAAKIAQTMGRTVSSVRSRAGWLGIFKAPKPRLAPIEPRPCAHCGVLFTPRRDHIKDGFGQNCSRLCARRGRIPNRPFSFAVIEEFSIPEPNSGCWLWTTGVGDQYGSVLVAGQEWPAHRLSYATSRNLTAIPYGLLIRHRCDNPACVNPEHLELGTHKDNARDAVQRGQMLRGSKVLNSKLTEEDIPTIRELARNGMSQRAISHRLGVCQSLISHIVTGKAWSHV